ncbi:MAG: LamG domain-containing protein [Bacteroidales bacterium]
MKPYYLTLIILSVTILNSCVTTKQLTSESEFLVGSYTFDNSSTQDLSRYGIEAELTEIEFVEDRFGNSNSAVKFNGASSKIECSDDNRNIKNSMTVMAWIKSETGDLPAVVAKYDWHEDNGYALRLREKGEAAMEGRDGNDKYQQSGHKGSLYDNNWHHIVGVVNNNEWKIYVDGELISSSVNENHTIDVSNTSTLTIGAFPVPNGKGNYRNFNGIIDEVLIYNTALNNKQIKSIYTTSKEKSL